MKRRIIWIALTFLMATSLVLASCSKSSTTSTSIITSATSTTNTTKSAATTTTTAQPITQTVTSTAKTGNWWDKLGMPTYGGDMVIRMNTDIKNFDPAGGVALNLMSAYMERLGVDDWTLDPAIFDYSIVWRPPDYVKGQLAENWEFTDSATIVFHIRKGVHWQDIPPANGRELIADDVVYHFNRMYGLGGGFTISNPNATLGAKFKDLISLTAPDKYTVIFKWKTPNPEAIMETMQSGGVEMNIECPDLVKQYGDTQDWHRAIGTGPFILKDLVAGSSATLMKNPNYWGYDERHSQNKIPYIDTLKVLIIPDDATALAALRTGKIDVMDQMLLSQAQSMKKTNPEILQSTVPYASGMTVNPKNSVAPFNDIRVRKAMQMALDLPTIAATYYGGTSDPHPLTLTSYFEKGWGLPYDQWPQDLKDEYTYNPTASKKLLADAGYPTGFKTNVVADAGGDLDLLQIVKSYFSQVGIDMEIRPMDGASWNTFVRVQMKYDQLAYRSQGSLGLTFEPMTQLNQFQTGLSVNYYGVSDPIFDTFYPKALASTSVDQIKQVVKDANLQVAQQHYLISILQAPTFAFAQPWLKGFSNQGKAVTATGAGPSYLGFYAARYWIDQNMKKGMGH